MLVLISYYILNIYQAYLRSLPLNFRDYTLRILSLVDILSVHAQYIYILNIHSAYANVPGVWSLSRLTTCCAYASITANI